MLVRAMCVYTRWLFGLTDEWCHIAVPAWILVISPGFFASYPLVNIQKTMENHHVQLVNPLFLWPFSIAMLNYQRVIGILEIMGWTGDQLPAVSAMARRRLGAVLWLSLLSLPGLGFFDFFAKPEEEDAPKGKVATATRRIREVDESWCTIFPPPKNWGSLK